MNISIRGSKIEITDAMKEYATEKLKKLEKYVESPEDIRATVIVKIPNHLHKVEITIPMKSVILRVEEEKEDFYAAIDVLIDKLERQIRKNKTRLQTKKIKEAKEFAFDYIEPILEEEENKILKRKKVEVKPMDEEEAILQMELLGHQFYLYKDIETGQPTVIYKRKDGNYGVIEAE
ncbi:MAG: ribosome-associated translation inhibitor RaiA [Bacilli bacterium]|nr:ribosome-associated translation inhibitor RaiA [Bacilli bacterium]